MNSAFSGRRRVFQAEPVLRERLSGRDRRSKKREPRREAAKTSLPERGRKLPRQQVGKDQDNGSRSFAEERTQLPQADDLLRRRRWQPTQNNRLQSDADTTCQQNVRQDHAHERGEQWLLQYGLPDTGRGRKPISCTSK